MATEWFRSWHNAPTDSKWIGVARKAGVKPIIVIAVWWALLDRASQAKDRGSIAGFDTSGFADFAGTEEADVQAVIGALKDKGLISADDVLTAWERRQPLREDPNITKRSQEKRERDRAANGADPDPSDGGGSHKPKRQRNATQGNAMQRKAMRGDATKHSETTDKDQIRSDQNIDGWMDTQASPACAPVFFELGEREGIPHDLLQAVLDAKGGSETLAMKALQRALEPDVKNLVPYLVGIAEGRPFERMSRKERKRQSIGEITRQMQRMVAARAAEQGAPGNVVDFSKAITGPNGQVFVRLDSPGWVAWRGHLKSPLKTTSFGGMIGGWFSSEYPPPKEVSA